MFKYFFIHVSEMVILDKYRNVIGLLAIQI